MNPDELMEWFTRACGAIQLAPHAEFLEREARYWRGEAERLSACLRVIEGTASDGLCRTGSSASAPEPPVGTQFHSAVTGERLFFRGDLGWYCNKDDCKNCPCDWAEASDRLPNSVRRTLPGMTTLPHQKGDT